MYLRSLLKFVILAWCMACVACIRPGEKHEKLIGYLGEVHSVENATKKADSPPLLEALHESIQSQR